MNDYQMVEYLQKFGLSNGTTLGHHSGAMDLIADRQQAEIERLEKHELSEALNYINQLETENKRLNKKVEELSEVLSDSIKIKATEIKSEAIKEFAERFKTEITDRYEDIAYKDLFFSIIDNLVKKW